MDSKGQGLLNLLIKSSYLTTIACVFFALFSLPRGHNYVENMVVVSIFLGFINYLFTKKHNKIDIYLTLSMLLYGIMLLISASMHGDLIRLSKAFLYTPLFLIFAPQLKHHKKVIGTSLFSGTLYLFYITISQYKAGVVRPDAFTNAILLSQAILIFFLFNLYFLKIVRPYWLKSIFLISASLSIIMLLLTQTRGVWLTLIILVAIFLIKKSTKKPFKYFLITIASIVTCISLYSFNTIIQNKINHAISDLNKVQSEEYNSSWGLRVLAWKSAFIDIKKYYLTGVGLNNFQVNKITQVENNQISPLIVQAKLYHTHNQYIQNLLIRGVLGLATLIFILISTAKAKPRGGKPNYLLYSIAASYAIFSISDVPFEYLNTTYLYLISISITYLYLSEDNYSA